MISVFGFSFFHGLGSKSSDISGVSSVENPLPPCPDSPNCIRITRQIDLPVDSVFSASTNALKIMNPLELTISKEDYKIESVFRVFIFKDDFMLKFTEKNPSSTYLHIRSASRIGKSDLGVNTRRVQKFLQHLQDHI